MTLPDLKQDLPSRRFAVLQADIDRYAEASGDRNPLHLDPDFAATTPFGRTIAHGMMTLAFLSQVLGAEIGEAWLQGGDLDVAFLGPVFPGDEVLVTCRSIAADDAAAIAADDAVIAAWEVECRVGERAVLGGKARLLAAETKTELETAS
ncbi:3-hydroxybutyryl-CoA dehydratase [Rhodoligotrophos appendicifer]|uniref:MaoC family dehydratase n=1 Tax=Rhodoligotrophos appendicifer TaxID=987056 RepID=UPI0011863BE3|nr:MaoC family dehydratase [Rhodoligotrophos appendicifer]